MARRGGAADAFRSPGDELLHRALLAAVGHICSRARPALRQLADVSLLGQARGMVGLLRRVLTPEIQYLQTTISEEQRQQYSQLVGQTIAQIEAGLFPSHSGIRFPQNNCLSCSCMGLCLGNQVLVDAELARKLGANDLDWLDQLDY